MDDGGVVRGKVDFSATASPDDEFHVKNPKMGFPPGSNIIWHR